MTPAQKRAARLLGQGYNSAAVARRLDISERTLRSWKKLPGFLENRRTDATLDEMGRAVLQRLR